MSARRWSGPVGVAHRRAATVRVSSVPVASGVTGDVVDRRRPVGVPGQVVEQKDVVARLVEVEHVSSDPASASNDAVAELRQAPVVLDEPQDRGLVDQRCGRRSSPARTARPPGGAVARRTRSASGRPVSAGGRRLPGAPCTSAPSGSPPCRRRTTCQRDVPASSARSAGTGGRTDRRSRPRQHHRGVLPFRQPLEPVQGVDQEVLLVEGVGVAPAGVAVLVARRLEEAHRGQVAVVGSGPEVPEVVLVLRLVVVADGRGRGRRQVVRVGGRGEVLEGVVVRLVVGLVLARRGWGASLPQTAVGSSSEFVRRNPPWNQPQETPASLSRSPTFGPVSEALRGRVGAVVEERVGIAVDRALGDVLVVVRGGPGCSPATRLSAPGVDGPYVVPNALSSSA